MRIPISWLKDYVTITQTPAELADMITNAGMEVDKIDYIGVEGADLVWDREKVLLAQVVKVEKHPDADKLLLVSADYGADELKVVVTGAPNLFDYIGMGDLTDKQLYSPIIFEGATYRDPYKDGKHTKLKGRPLRGIYNDAMLCSAVELGVGDDHDGILLIEKDETSPDYVAGTPLQDVLGDAVLEVDIIPNIARTASIVGIAREVAALTGETLRYPSYDVVMEGAPVAGRVKITTEHPDLNPRFVAILIEGVSQKPSPFWMQQRLKLAGQRPINVVVDISNYVMLEMGQPNHTFDYDFMRKRADQYAADGPVHILTRLAQADETLKTLDGAEHKLHANNLLVADPQGNLSLSGIMGGFDSEIQPETQNVLLEAAAWNFINIRHSSRQLGMHTEAGFRFSRGVHPSQALLGAKRAAELLRVLAGGTVADGIIDYYPNEPAAVTVELDHTYAETLSGLTLSTQEMADLLAKLEFTIDDVQPDKLTVTAPDHRLDIEGPHDLVEEICRMYRYDRVPSTVLSATLPPQRSNVTLDHEEHIKDVLVQMGLQEIITYRLTTAEAERKVLTGAPDDRPYVTLANPSTNERVSMRHNLLASALEIVAANSRFQERIALFEIGQIYLRDEAQQLPSELPRLSMVMTGKRAAAHWQGDAPALYDFYDLKGVIEGLMADLTVKVRYESAEHPSFRPGRTAKLFIGDKQTSVGVMGELHPLVVEQYGIQVDDEQAVLAADIDLSILLAAIPEQAKIEQVSVYPAVREDLALVVEAGMPASKVEAALVKAGGFLLKRVELFDVYEGDNIAAGKKSLAYHLTFQSPAKTLTEKDIQNQRKRILKQMKGAVSAELR